MATTNEAQAALLNAADRRARFPIIHVMRRVSRSGVSACGDVRGRVAATTSEEGGQTPACAAGSSTVPGRLGATRIYQTGPALVPYEAGAPSRRRRLVISTMIALALVSHTALTSLHAQDPDPETNQTDQWVNDGGSIEVDTKKVLVLREGETRRYRFRLTRPVPFDGWWVRVHVDGAVRADGKYDADGDGDFDIRWVPSVGREFAQRDWPQNQQESPWRDVSITALKDKTTTIRTSRLLSCTMCGIRTPTARPACTGSAS